MRAVVRVLLTLVLLVAAGLLGYDMASYYLYSPWTRDARVRANVVTVRRTFPVGLMIFACGIINSCTRATCSSSIDQERYRLALADAEAALAAQHAQYLMLLDQYERRSKLSPGYTITVENLDNARRQSESAAASYQQAIASRDTAALNLKRTEVRASVNGFITNLNLANGTYASQGKPVMALIDSDSYRVGAYFEETKIPHIRPGASAEIYLMDGSPALQGTVVGISRGITDSTTLADFCAARDSQISFSVTHGWSAFWRGRPWLAGRRIGKTSLDVGSSRFWIGWVTKRGDKCARSTCRD